MIFDIVKISEYIKQIILDIHKCNCEVDPCYQDTISLVAPPFIGSLSDKLTVFEVNPKIVYFGEINLLCMSNPFGTDDIINRLAVHPFAADLDHTSAVQYLFASSDLFQGNVSFKPFFFRALDADTWNLTTFQQLTFTGYKVTLIK